MNVFLLILALIFFVVLSLVGAMRPVRPSLSEAELRRRAKHAASYAEQLRQFELAPLVEAYLRMRQVFLMVIIAGLLFAAAGWILGGILLLAVLIIYVPFAHTRLMRKAGDALYKKMEPAVLRFVERFQGVFRFVGSTNQGINILGRFDSREELAEYIERSKEVLSEDERALLTSALQFPDIKIETIMTPRTVIDTIEKNEFLGPLVLNELHSLGHSRLPVIKGDIDHVVGILHLRDLLSLDVRRSVTAEKAMEKKVYYIHQNDTAEHALAAFLKTRHHLFIVINAQRETVGLVTLEDVLEALLGRQIVDEDDIHADLHAVAEQKGRANNNSAGHVDL